MPLLNYVRKRQRRRRIRLVSVQWNYFLGENYFTLILGTRSCCHMFKRYHCFNRTFYISSGSGYFMIDFCT